MIPRPELVSRVQRSLAENPVVAILGPRQCGKTTLAHMVSEERSATFFDLENPVDLAQLRQPMLALQNLEGLVVIDEVQRMPKLLEILRVLVDRRNVGTRFIVLGSASPSLVRGASESLAGRIGFVDMAGFDLREVGASNYRHLWQRGGFPRSYLAADDAASFRWRNDFVRTFLERDIPQLGISVPAATLRRFWTMVAHFHGNRWNASEFARSLGTSEGTARRYLDLLSATYVVRQLQPWYQNLAKRQVKSPKIYVRDSGVLHALLAIGTGQALYGHPKYGASWEGFALEQTLQILGVRESYYWATHSGAELDLLLIVNGHRIGFEFKCEDAPRMTRSMAIALNDLDLHRIEVVYPGDTRYQLHERIGVLPIQEVPALSGRLWSTG